MQRVVLIIAAIAAIAGVFARFAFLDRPLFFKDEAITSLFTTGHSYGEYEALFDGKPHTAAEVMAVMRVDPARGPAQTVAALAAEDPHHAPGFFVLERMWIGLFGSSVTAFRSLPVVLGLLAIALAFTLLRRLDGTQSAAIGAALCALSPLFVSLSRDAREYALLIDMVLVSTIALLQALDRASTGAWLAYGVCVAAGMYVDTIFIFVIASHGAIAAWFARSDARLLAVWAVSALLGAATFLPWAINALHASERIGAELDWAKTPYSLKYAALKWTFNVGALAFDGEFAALRYGVLGVLAAAIVLGSIAYIALRAPDRVRIPPLALALGTIVAFLAIDALEHAHFSTIARYLCAAWVGLELCVALAFARLMATARWRWLGFGAWAAVLALGCLSFAIRRDAENWWTNTDDIAYQAVARTIDERPGVPVVIENRDQITLELARYLPPDARLILIGRRDDPTRSLVAPAYLVAPSAVLLRAVASEGFGAASNVSPTDVSALRQARGAASTGPSDAVTATNALWFIAKR